ncbi:MAG: hypothetical protein H6671_00325 [Anaerolineaceae bacterium]|nr:hypothetical protein [Anaerolineaceae bacterium]
MVTEQQRQLRRQYTRKNLVILSNVRGLYRHFPDEASFVGQVQAGQIDDAMHWAQGRMKRKVLGAKTALESGVRRVVIGDGRVVDPVSRALTGKARYSHHDRSHAHIDGN